MELVTIEPLLLLIQMLGELITGVSADLCFGNATFALKVFSAVLALDPYLGIGPHLTAVTE